MIHMKTTFPLLASSLSLCALVATGCKSGPLPEDAVWMRWENPESADQGQSLEVKVAGKSSMADADAVPVMVPMTARNAGDAFEVEIPVSMTARVLRSQTCSLVSGRWSYPDTRTEGAMSVKPGDPIPEGAPPLKDLPSRKWVSVDRPVEFGWSVELKLSHTDGVRRSIPWSGTAKLTGTEGALRISLPTEQLRARIEALEDGLSGGRRNFVLEVKVSCTAGTSAEPLPQRWNLSRTGVLSEEQVLGTRRTASAAP